MDYNELATQYAEKHGIINYSVTGDKMTYRASHPSTRKEDRTTYKIMVDLPTQKEEQREPLKRYYKQAEDNAFL